MSMMPAYMVLAALDAIPDVEGLSLDAFLGASGVRHFTAREVARPHNARAATRLGYKNLDPGSELWPRVGAVLLLCDVCRDAASSPVRLRNLWRPDDYNAAVGGSVDSDHIHCLGADLDFRTADACRRAEGAVRALHERYPQLRISLGIGRKSLHVGLLTRRGTRTWGYGFFGRRTAREFPLRRRRAT